MSIGATTCIMSRVIENKICLKYLFSVFSFRVLRPASCKVNMKLDSPTFKTLQKIGDENFSPDLLQNMVTGSMKILARRLLACSRLSVSEDDRKRKQAISGISGERDPAHRPLALSIVSTDREPGTG